MLLASDDTYGMTMHWVDDIIGQHYLDIYMESRDDLSGFHLVFKHNAKAYFYAVCDRLRISMKRDTLKVQLEPQTYQLGDDVITTYPGAEYVEGLVLGDTPAISIAHADKDALGEQFTSVCETGLGQYFSFFQEPANERRPMCTFSISIEVFIRFRALCLEAERKLQLLPDE